MSDTLSSARESHTRTARAPRRARLWEVASTFLRLGCISFGGPIAHLGYLRAECVDKRRWLGEAE